MSAVAKTPEEVRDALVAADDAGVRHSELRPLLDRMMTELGGDVALRIWNAGVALYDDAMMDMIIESEAAEGGAS